ncbi:MAG: hypothetical protein HZB51_22450 [Chloroflexi bacterium]|nr:hypothetical protein [Chloroflexota bacterium]
MQQANTACNYISEIAWQTKTFSRYALQRHIYGEVRRVFGLSAQMTIRCIAKVADAYQLDQRRKRTFKPLGAITYDDRILSWRITESQVSIWTTDGRLKIPFVYGDKQRELLITRQGESDLIFFQRPILLVCHV